MYVNLTAVVKDHAGGIVESLEAMLTDAVLSDDRLGALELTEAGVQAFVLHAN